jgi:hypothetical protein
VLVSLRVKSISLIDIEYSFSAVSIHLNDCPESKVVERRKFSHEMPNGRKLSSLIEVTVIYAGRLIIMDRKEIFLQNADINQVY